MSIVLDKLKLTATIAAVGAVLLVASARAEWPPGIIVGVLVLLASPYISLFIVSRRVRSRAGDH